MPSLVRADVRPGTRTVVIAATLVALSVLVFALLARSIAGGRGLPPGDQAVLTWCVKHRTDWMIRAARSVSAIAGFLPLSAIAVILAVWLRRRGWRIGLAVAPLLSLSLGALASTTTKAIFDRERPPVELHAAKVVSAAFPSGHATDAAAFFLAVSFTLALALPARRSAQALLIGTGLFLAGLVGLSRLILAVHWLSDVIAGWALGTAIAITVVMTMWFVTTRRPTRAT